MINLTLQTVFFCALSITEYHTNKNLTETESHHSMVLSNIQSTWLSRKLKASVQSTVMDSILVSQKQYLKGNFCRDYTKYDNNDNNNNNK